MATKGLTALLFIIIYLLALLGYIYLVLKKLLYIFF